MEAAAMQLGQISRAGLNINGLHNRRVYARASLLSANTLMKI